MNVREIVIAHLKSIGADGLRCDDCGCGLDDLFACECERDVSACKPAKRHTCDGTCSGCLSEGEHDRANACYRPMDTNEPEDTHL